MESTDARTQAPHEHYWKDRPVKKGEYFRYTGKRGGRFYPNPGTVIRECQTCGQKHLVGEDRTR